MTTKPIMVGRWIDLVIAVIIAVDARKVPTPSIKARRFCSLLLDLLPVYLPFHREWNRDSPRKS